MSTSRVEIEPVVIRVEVTDEFLTAHLADGRQISVPLSWYPRLVHGTPDERGRYEIFGGGHGIHWPDLDEDISVENLIEGHPSGESDRSFQRWLDSRKGQGPS